MGGYTRADTGNNIADGNVVNASDLDAEYDAIEAAFNNSTGHTHDGTSAEGAPIEVAGPAQDLVITATEVRPKTDNTLDLGTTTLEFKDAFFDGTVKTDTLTVDENATVTGNLTVNGNTTLGNAATDTVTVTADVASDLIPSADGTYDLGASGSEWQDLYLDGTANIDSLVADTADMNGGTIDNTVIGGSTPAAGSFTTGQFGTSLNVDGTVTADGLTVDGSGTAIDLRSNNNAGTALNTLRFTDTDVTAVNNAEIGKIEFYATDTAAVVASIAGRNADASPDGYLQFNTAEVTTLRRRMIIDNNGDISFYEDTGTTPKFFWDASEERLEVNGTIKLDSGAYQTAGMRNFFETTIANGATADLALDFGAGNRFFGLLLISLTRTSSANLNTSSIFAYNCRGVTGNTVTSLFSANGTDGAASFSVSSGSASGVLRITNNSGGNGWLSAMILQGQNF